MERSFSFKRWFIEYPTLESFVACHSIRSAIVCGENGLSLLILIDENRLYGIGRNEAGILGQGHGRPIREVAEIVEMRDKTIASIDCGLYHTVVRITDGKVYGWGGSQYGQCCKSKGYVKPTVLLDGYRIKSIQCGYNFNLALTYEGTILSWGSNNYGQLGGGKCHARTMPMALSKLKCKNIAAIACGGWHSLALTTAGEIYSWGSNDSGQLCKEDYDDGHNIHHPTLIELVDYPDTKFKAIAAGWGHSLFLSDDGDVFSCGLNSQGQLGLRTENVRNTQPVVVKAPSGDRYKSIYTKDRFSYAITESGVVMAWGKVNDRLSFCNPIEVFPERFLL